MKATPLRSFATGCLPSAMSPAELRLFAFKVLAIVGAAGCNIGLNFYNSWAMKESGGGPHFDFPFFYTMFHPLAGVLGSSLIHCFKPPASGAPSFAQAWEYRTVIVPIAILSTLNIGLNNASLTLSASHAGHQIPQRIACPPANSGRRHLTAYVCAPHVRLQYLCS